MAISSHAELEYQSTPMDLLLERSVEAVVLAPSFFYELLYSEPVTGNKSPLQAIASNWLGFWREKQAERIALFLLYVVIQAAYLCDDGQLYDAIMLADCALEFFCLFKRIYGFSFGISASLWAKFGRLSVLYGGWFDCGWPFAIPLLPLSSRSSAPTP